MRIFLKNLKKDELNILDQYPVQGVVFEIEQKNAELINSCVKEIPFYLTTIGEIPALPKYEIEELIHFCRLDGVVVKDESYSEKLNVFRINWRQNSNWNALVKTNNGLETAKYDLEDIILNKDLVAVVLTLKELKVIWPKLVESFKKI